MQYRLVARALYDNVAETPDELAFRKGDVLAVLEQNTAGLEGWWLCSHRGRQVTHFGEQLETPMVETEPFRERSLSSGAGPDVGF